MVLRGLRLARMARLAKLIRMPLLAELANLISGCGRCLKALFERFSILFGVSIFMVKQCSEYLVSRIFKHVFC